MWLVMNVTEYDWVPISLKNHNKIEIQDTTQETQKEKTKPRWKNNTKRSEQISSLQNTDKSRLGQLGDFLLEIIRFF